jgi:hypothetical protein
MEAQIVLPSVNLHTISFDVLIMFDVQIKMHKMEFAFRFFVRVKLVGLIWIESVQE